MTVNNEQTFYKGKDREKNERPPSGLRKEPGLEDTDRQTDNAHHSKEQGEQVEHSGYDQPRWNDISGICLSGIQ